jgi:phosphoribosylpyrophosphate synthetase
LNNCTVKTEEEYVCQIFDTLILTSNTIPKVVKRKPGHIEKELFEKATWVAQDEGSDEISLVEHKNRFNVVCPDAGAGKRVEKIVQTLIKTFPHVEFNLIRCEKVRDVATGQLKEFFVQANDLNKYPTMIIDDILCLGGTFVGLGEVLKKKNCGRLYLYTSHCDCIEGIGNMTKFFDRVYTTNSKKNWDEFEYEITCLKIRL